MFWAKMVAFLAVGLISIGPTRAFIKWVKVLPDEAAIKSIRRFVMIELHVFVLVPLFAVLMARGFGL